MDRTRKDEVWKDFWEHQRAATSPAVVSAEWNTISKAQFDAWIDFADKLPQGGRVLDLATGAGKLPLMLHETRPDLAITGIDIADPLPPVPQGITLLGGVAMDDLPFEDDSFDVVVSQFGFEYGDPAQVGTEVLRVLKPTGKIGLMIHRGDGPILAHNRAREEQLRWVKEDQRLFERIRELIPAGSATASQAIELAKEIAALGQQRYGKGAVGWELPAAVHQTLTLGPRGNHDKLIETLNFIEAQSDNELGRIASLAQACAAADDRDTLLKAFFAAGRNIQSATPVALADAAPFANLLLI